jgi:hypothetical protein
MTTIEVVGATASGFGSAFFRRWRTRVVDGRLLLVVVELPLAAAEKSTEKAAAARPLRTLPA